MVIRLYILDRIEGNVAAIENTATGEIINVGKNLLPADVKEGDGLSYEGGFYVKDINFTQIRVKKAQKFLEDLWE